MALCSRSLLYQLTHCRVSHSTWAVDFQGPRKLMTSVLNIWRGPWPQWGRVSPGMVDALGHCVVIAVADAAHRGVDACIGQPLGVADRQILAAAVGG